MRRNQHVARVDGSSLWKPEERQHQTFFYFAGRRTTKVVTLCDSLFVRVAQAFRFVSRFLFATLHQSNETSMPHDSHHPADPETHPNTSVGSESLVPRVHFAWLQLRMGWPTVGKIRLDQEKKDAIASIISHYEKVGTPDRAQTEFDQVLQRLEEEHAMRLRELLKEQRRAAKQQNNPIQIIQETNASKVRQRVELTEETPPLIEEWKRLIDRLF